MHVISFLVVKRYKGLHRPVLKLENRCFLKSHRMATINEYMTINYYKHLKNIIFFLQVIYLESVSYVATVFMVIDEMHMLSVC